MKHIVMAVSGALALLSGSAFAADAGFQNSGGAAAAVTFDGVLRDGPPENWGGATNSAKTYVAHAFAPMDSGVTYAFVILGNNISIVRTNATGSPWMEAPIDLPTGSLLQSVEFRFCDTNINAGFTSFLTIESRTGAALQQPTLVFSTNGEDIGCVNRTFTFTPALLIDNGANAYSLEVYLGASNNSIAVSQARMFYRLQVSPAPATATFPNDVPTSHPLFRFVEAMAASGITGGCGTGAFCPDSPLTRGQMAVFLATGLGLHFPN